MNCLIVPGVICIAIVILPIGIRFVVKSPEDWTGASLISMAGAIITFYSLFIGWVVLSPTDYVISGPLQDVMPDILELTFGFFEVPFIGWIPDLLEHFLAVPGYLLLIVPVIRVFFPADNYLRPVVAVAPLLVMLVGFYALMWNTGALFLSTRQQSQDRKFHLALIQIIVSLGALLSLILTMPAIDAFLSNEYVEVSMTAAIGNLHMGRGVWVALIGLLCLVIGGIAQLISAGTRPTSLEY